MTAVRGSPLAGRGLLRPLAGRGTMMKMYLLVAAVLCCCCVVVLLCHCRESGSPEPMLWGIKGFPIVMDALDPDKEFYL